MYSYEQAKFRMPLFLGIIFGFAFLNRIEGIIFLGIIPYFTQYIWFGKTLLDGKKLLLFNGLYVFVFFIGHFPQIYMVSSKMDRFALNGREAWSLILHNPDGKSYEEKLCGLTYSETNKS
jgi:hypothetical protein